MPFTPASPGSVAAFLVIVAAVIAMFLGGVHASGGPDPAQARRSTLRMAVGLAVWLVLLAVPVADGVLAKLPWRGLPFFFGGILVVSLAAGPSPLGGRLAAG